MYASTIYSILVVPKTTIISLSLPLTCRPSSRRVQKCCKMVHFHECSTQKSPDLLPQITMIAHRTRKKDCGEKMQKISFLGGLSVHTHALKQKKNWNWKPLYGARHCYSPQLGGIKQRKRLQIFSGECDGDLLIRNERVKQKQHTKLHKASYELRRSVPLLYLIPNRCAKQRWADRILLRYSGK